MFLKSRKVCFTQFGSFRENKMADLDSIAFITGRVRHHIVFSFSRGVVYVCSYINTEVKIKMFKHHYDTCIKSSLLLFRYQVWQPLYT